jgi:hypothetical protein
MAQFRQKGNLLSKLSSEPFRKRLTKIRNEQNTLANSTGDSALFIAIGFGRSCQWSLPSGAAAQRSSQKFNS